MNLAELRAHTRLLGGVELDGLRSDAEIDALIVSAYRQIGNRTTWRWRDAVAEVAVVQSDDEYDVSSDIVVIEGVSIIDAPGQTLPVTLKEVPLRDLLTRIPRDREDLPRFYARTGSKLRLGPIPDRSYTVEVFGQKPLQGLALGASVPEWDEQFHEAISYLAASQYLAEEGQEELSKLRKHRAEEIFIDMVSFYERTADTTPVVMGGGQGVLPRDHYGRLWPWR